ncbi:MAG: nucleotide exchange factor GrpE, partial [Chloroflexi bacterium]|nr:nucleotide exchange factor GrpE [Chloroflexota bacterium]
MVGQGEQQTSEGGADAASMSEAELRQAYEEEKAKAERFLGAWQRAQADFVNLRRRSEQERLDTSKYAGSVVLLQVAPVLDDLERALNTVDATLADHTWVNGIRLISRKLQAALESQGL